MYSPPNLNNAEPPVPGTKPDTLDAQEALQKDRVLISTYDPDNQFGVADLEREFPQRREVTTYEDPELVAISYARTQALREIDQQTGEGNLRTTTGGAGLLWAIRHTPPEVGESFAAHGLSNKFDPIIALDKLLTEGMDGGAPLETMPFKDISKASPGFADRPLTSGGLIILDENPLGIYEKRDLKYVVVGEEYMRVFDLMRNRYPQTTFVPWDKAPEFLSRKANEAGLTDMPLASLQVGEPVYYPEQVDIGRPRVEEVGAVATSGQVEPEPGPLPAPPPVDDDTPNVW